MGEGTIKELWTYAGRRLSNAGDLVHELIDTGGTSLIFAVKRGREMPTVIGGIYEVNVVHKAGGTISLTTRGEGSPRWTRDYCAATQRAEYEAQDTAAYREVERRKVEKKAADNGVLDRALETISNARQAVPVPQRAAFDAYVLGRLRR